VLPPLVFATCLPILASLCGVIAPASLKGPTPLTAPEQALAQRPPVTDGFSSKLFLISVSCASVVSTVGISTLRAFGVEIQKIQ